MEGADKDQVPTPGLVSSIPKRSSLMFLFLLSWLDKWASLNRIFRHLCWEQTGLICWDNSLRFNLSISSWDYTLGGINDSFSTWLHLHDLYPENASSGTWGCFTPYSYLWLSLWNTACCSASGSNEWLELKWASGWLTRLNCFSLVMCNN